MTTAVGRLGAASAGWKRVEVDAVGHDGDRRAAGRVARRLGREVEAGGGNRVGAGQGVAGQPAVKGREARRLEDVGAPDGDDEGLEAGERAEEAVAGQVQRVQEVGLQVMDKLLHAASVDEVARLAEGSAPSMWWTRAPRSRPAGRR